MKDGKIDVKSVGITIVLAVVGTCVGLCDFISQRVNIMNFLSGILKIKPMVTTEIIPATDLVNGMSFGGITLVVLVLAIVCIAIAMGSIKGMA